MDKTISIIVPYYKESTEMLFPLLSSINNQLGIDFNKIEVLLVNDGANNRLPEEFLGMFNNLDIRTCCLMENRGPGVARQCGIEEAQGEYVMFCDADDVLHNVAVLARVSQLG